MFMHKFSILSWESLGYYSWRPPISDMSNALPRYRKSFMKKKMMLEGFCANVSLTTLKILVSL